MLNDGRRVLNVAVKLGTDSDSWGVGTGGLAIDPTIAQAASGGMELWNVARDPSASTGRTTPNYYFDSPSNVTYATQQTYSSSRCLVRPLGRAGAP